MLCKLRRRSAILVAAALAISSPVVAQEKPVPIRLGTTTTSGEDQIWLMKARPDLTPNQGKAYTLETFPFRGGDLRFKAFQAGQVDGAVSTGTGAVTAATKGVPPGDRGAHLGGGRRRLLDALRRHGRVADQGASRISRARRSGSTACARPLSLARAWPCWTRASIPTGTCTWAVVPPPNMGDALRRGKVDLAASPATVLCGGRGARAASERSSRITPRPASRKSSSSTSIRIS